MTEAVPAEDKRVALGDTVACEVRHPYPSTIALTLATPESVEYARRLLLRDSSWKLVRGAGSAMHSA